MIKFVKSVWENYRAYLYLGGAAVVIIGALGGFIAYQNAKLESAGVKLTAAENKLAETNTAFIAFQAHTQNVINGLAKQNEENNAALAKARQREKEIRNVPKDQDGGVAPVMLDSLSRLR